MATAAPENKNREFLSVLAVWLILAVALLFLALPNTTAPGLYYDEALFAGLAKDFLTGHAHPHLLGNKVMNLLGHPFPTFVQSYCGAVKSWLLMPVFAVFGASQPVLRFASLGWGLLALLLFMLWTWRWLGRKTAMLAGVLLASDPTFFFINVLDWGLVVPSFLCRFACFYCALRWWQLRHDPKTTEQKVSNRRTVGFAFLAGFFAGLGFFNKIDFAIILGGVLFALLCCNARKLWEQRYPDLAPSLAFIVTGFLLTGGLMLTHIPGILNALPTAGQSQGMTDEMTEKFNAAMAMYDGSYFYRLMDAGGIFNKMYQTRAPVFALAGIALVVAAAFLFFRSAKRTILRIPSGDPAAFILLATLFITIGIFLLPKAARIHHMVLVYPFPQLVVALAVSRLVHQRWVAGLYVLLIASQLLVLYRTQQLIRQTGGRGWWSDAIGAFASQVKDRSDLTLVSLDWGFNEQLGFLTDGPTLIEPFWMKAHWDARSTNVSYLLHPPEYALYPFGQSYLDGARREGPAAVELKPWSDHQDRVVFYSMRFLVP